MSDLLNHRTATSSGSSEQRRSLVDIERPLLAAVADGGSLQEQLSAIARTTDELTRWRCAMFLADEAGSQLRLAAAGSLPDSIAKVLTELSIGPASGGPAATAAYRKAPAFAPNLDVEPVFATQREALREAGLRSMWAAPIWAGAGRIARAVPDVVNPSAAYNLSNRPPSTRTSAPCTNAASSEAK